MADGNQSSGDDCPPLAPVKYEYLDHTADVQLHSWGDNLEEAFEQVSSIIFPFYDRIFQSFNELQVAISMFGYMTHDISTVEAKYSYDIEASGDDLPSLLFHFLDEWLFAFSAEPFFIAKCVKILEFDRNEFKIKARGWGESFDLAKHPAGTEVKAITYSNMQIYDDNNKHEVYVIIDI